MLSLAHGCAIWMPLSATSKEALESIKHSAAKIALRTKLNTPRSDVLLELSWEPISAFIDRQNISYFRRLSELPGDSLCKII